MPFAPVVKGILLERPIRGTGFACARVRGTGMLKVSTGEWGSGSMAFSGRTLAELDALVDRFAAAPPLSSSGPDVMGDHAWISVIDRGFVAHFYFGEGCRDAI